VNATERFLDGLHRADLLRVHGRVIRSIGAVVEASGPPSFVGEICRIDTGRNDRPILAEVVGFADGRVLLMPWERSDGLRPGSEVVGTGRALSVETGDKLLGRVLDGLGRPIDGLGPIQRGERRLVRGPRLAPLDRVASRESFVTGVRSIDGFVTVARGQRLGLFAGGGVGKSVLLGMIARSSVADVNVLALVGERGREVVDFLENELGPEGRRRSVVIAATSDDSPLQRVQAARVAAAVAESFRDLGKNVLLLMDSLTRVAMAQREIGLAAGEPPATRGYPPSSFAMLPEIVERAGATRAGSITGFYTVLLEGDDIDAPVSDAARAVLDGHIVLSREMAVAGIYPAVDIIESVSRLRDDVQDADMNRAARDVIELEGTRRSMADLLSIGAYKTGTNPRVDRAVRLEERLRSFQRQPRDEASSWNDTRSALLELRASSLEAMIVPTANGA